MYLIGVDWAHFRQAVHEDLPRPHDLPQPGRHMICFVGLLDDWVDTELLETVATCHPKADLVLIGECRVSTDRLRTLPNVYLLGRRPYSALPGYLRACDVAVIPFRLSELTRAVNPIKLREYISSGTQVVATDLPELASFRGRAGLTIAATHSQFIDSVAECLEHPLSNVARVSLSDSMQDDSWSARLATMLELLDGLL